MQMCATIPVFVDKIKQQSSCIRYYNCYTDGYGKTCTTKHRLYLIFTIYHQGFFHSVRRNPSLNCLHRCRSLAILGHEGPRWWIRLSLHLVLGLPCRLFHSRGVHSVTLFVHLLSLNRAMCPAHPCIPFLITSMISLGIYLIYYSKFNNHLKYAVTLQTLYKIMTMIR